MSQASQSEVHIYLLQQAIKGLGEESVEDHAKDILEKTEAFETILISQAKKRKLEYKPKDIIEYIESSLRVRPFEEVSAYINNLDKNMLDQVINMLMKTNPLLLKRIFVNNIVKKPEVEQSAQVSVIDPAEEFNALTLAKLITESDIIVNAKRKPEYKPKDIIQYIESSLKVRPHDEVFAYVKGLDKDMLDQVINVLMKSNPELLKRIFVSTIVQRPEIEVEADPIKGPDAHLLTENEVVNYGKIM
jgi:hypothetical protein